MTVLKVKYQDTENIDLSSLGESLIGLEEILKSFSNSIDSIEISESRVVKIKDGSIITLIEIIGQIDYEQTKQILLFLKAISPPLHEIVMHNLNQIMGAHKS